MTDNYKRIKELEERLKEQLILTGLITDVNAYSGNLKNPEDPWCLEYKVKNNEHLKKNEKRIEILRRRLIKILIQNNPEILEIKRYYNKRNNLYKEILVINSKAKIKNETGFREMVLNTLNKELRNYAINNAR